MIHSQADILARYLHDEDLLTQQTTDEEWPTTVGFMPESDEDAIAVFNTTPKLSGRLHKTGLTLEHPGIQIRVRAQDEQIGYDKAAQLSEALDALLKAPVSLDGEDYVIHSATKTSGVLCLGVERGTQRRLFTVNAVLSIRTPA